VVVAFVRFVVVVAAAAAFSFLQATVPRDFAYVNFVK
jgi:hypothetical protein